MSKNRSLTFFEKLKCIDKQLLLTTILLIIIGTLSIVSASSRETVSRYDYSPYHYFFQQMIMLGASFIGAFIIFKFPTKSYKFFGPLLYIAVIACLIGLFVYSSIKRGSINWLTIGKFTFQPSEFAKPILIVCLSIYFERISKEVNNPNFDNLKFIAMWVLIGLIIPGLVFFQGDLGTALILGFISFSMFLASPISTKVKGKSCLVLAGAAILVGLTLFMGRGYLLTSEQKSRLDFFNPCSKYEDSGYQVCNGMIAINTGKLSGVGIGKSKQKYSYIPDPHTDSIFAVIVEETGLVMGVVILLIYLWMISRIYKICVNASTIRGRYICFGALIYLSLHIIFNLGGLLAILPLTGVPLPLISYGGSFTISFIAMLTMVQCVNVESRNKIIKIKEL